MSGLPFTPPGVLKKRAAKVGFTRFWPLFDDVKLGQARV
jgi:hypothetical protein